MATTRSHRGPLWLVVAVILMTRIATAQPTPPNPPRVVVTKIEGPLSDSMIATINRAMKTAEEKLASYLLVEIDTPGGQITTMERIGARLDASPVEPISYVTHEALSAGAYIAMSGTRIYTNERAQIGSALPILMIPGLGVIPDLDQEMRDLLEKQRSALRSKFRNRAERLERPGMPALAEAMVDPDIEVLLVAQGRDEIPMTRTEYEDLVRTNKGSVRIIRTLSERGQLVNLTSREAFDLGLTDGIVDSRREVLDALGIVDAEVIVVLPNWSEVMVSKLDGVRWWLIGLGLMLLAVEFFFAPGTMIPALLGAACIGVVMLSNYLVGLAELPEILLIILGIVLLAIEIFVIPGFGAFGISGITCIAIGVIFSFLPFLVPDEPIETLMLRDTLRNLSLAVLGTFLGIMVASRFIVRKTPFFYRRMVLDTGATADSLAGSATSLGPIGGELTIRVGDHGVVSTDLRPSGKVTFGDDVVEARSGGGFLSRGEGVEVVAVESTHVVVRKSSQRDHELT